MDLKCLPWLIALFVCVHCKSYKICVPAQFISDCREMQQVETKSKINLECVAARDRMECLSFVQQRQADFVPVDPEDMYIASKIPNQDFVLFQEYRTNDEPDAEFRYQAVIVVHKDLPINSLDELKGLKSCHTGVNRNVGYKIPLTMLMKRGVFPKMNDHSISPKENELKALATFFNKSCIVGNWSPDLNTNTTWKHEYKQLCSLCQHPDICNYPDDFSGYEGALKCLAHNGGQVAFTKVFYVHKFFGLPLGTIPAHPSSEDPTNFRYLCVDGSKVPVGDQRPCSWAARPWQGLLGHNDLLAQVNPLREKIKQLSNFDLNGKSMWFSNVLGLSERNHYVANVLPIKPVDYLKKANYTEVIERGHGVPEHIVRMCVTSSVALAKCRAMSQFAFSRDIRPRLDCVQESSEADCLKSVQDNGSDLASVDDVRVVKAAEKYGLHAVLHEVYGQNNESNYAVAVIKKGTNYNTIDDLRGKRSCHNPYGTFSGLHAPLFYLLNKNKVPTTTGNCVGKLSQFFTAGSCLPGVDKLENNPEGADVSLLLKQCSTDNDPLKCLEEGRADIAFVSSADLHNNDESKYELLCLNDKSSGGRDKLSNYNKCNIVELPSRTWLASKTSTAYGSIAHTLLSLADLLKTKSDLFNIYGEFFKNNNVIFNNAAKGLVSTDTLHFQNFKMIHDVINSCGIV